MKKIITLGILILFALSGFLPSVIGFSSDSEESFSFKSGCQVFGNIIIVDDEGDGDYTSIKDALNHANPDDTIEVYSGTYYEHGIDIIEERITLQGIPYELGNGGDTGKPFINGEGKNYVIFFDAKNITLDSFHIENKDGTTHDIIDLSQNADGCTISNNDLAFTDFCFIFVEGSNNTIINNNISHSAIDDGITLYYCSNCLVSGNTISDVETGIELWDSNQNIVTGNKISSCSRFGIDIASSNVNTVKDNTFEYNTVGIHIYISRFNTIKSNTFEDNNVGVYIDKSLGSRIKNNNIINNQYQADFIYGLFVYGFTNRWNGNYWGEPRSTPYPIRGAYLFFPWIQFDWRPAKEPYDI